MPHLFFLGTVFILWQMNEVGDFETLLYKMWHCNQQHFDVTSIWTSENCSGSWNGGVLKNGITDGQPCSESGNSPSTSNISNSQKSECYISIPNIQHTSKNQHDTNIWHVTLLLWYCNTTLDLLRMPLYFKPLTHICSLIIPILWCVGGLSSTMNRTWLTVSWTTAEVTVSSVWIHKHL